jgi:hypothetical protein
MLRFDQSILVCVFALICGCLASESVVAQTVDTTADNLMVVLRESIGGNEPDETLKPLGKIRTEPLSDGRQIDLEIAAFHFLGDMDIRIVFDAPGFMKVLKPADPCSIKVEPGAGASARGCQYQASLRQPDREALDRRIDTGQKQVARSRQQLFPRPRFLARSSPTAPGRSRRGGTEARGTGIHANDGNRSSGAPAKGRRLPVREQRTDARFLGSVSVQG